MKGTYLKAFLVGAGVVLGVIAFIMGFFALWYAAIAYWYITIPLLVLWGGVIGVLIARDE